MPKNFGEQPRDPDDVIVETVIIPPPDLGAKKNNVEKIKPLEEREKNWEKIRPPKPVDLKPEERGKEQ